MNIIDNRNMKKKYLLFGVLATGMLLAMSCGKEKSCRCSVLNSSRVRVVKIASGNCEDIKVFTYHDPIDSVKTDSLLCMDYEFEIDSLFEK